MKTFELTMRLRNNRIKRRRLDLGLSVRDAAAAAGVSYQCWLDYEGMRKSPLSSGQGASVWRPNAESVARFFGLPPEDLFPVEVLSVASPEITREIEAQELLATRQIQELNEANQLPGQDERLDSERAKLAVRAALRTLTPKEARVLKLRFEGDMTLEETGAQLGLSKERARAIQNQALRKLRHPSRSSLLAEYQP